MNRTRFDTETGRRVTRLLVEARSTQRRLARLLGVPHSTLNQMITGRLPPGRTWIAMRAACWD